MKNLAFWKFLVLALIIVCSFGCAEVRDVSDDIIRVSPDPDPSDPADVAEDEPVKPQEKPPEQVDSTLVKDEPQDSQEVLAEIKDILAEIEDATAEIERGTGNGMGSSDGPDEGDNDPPEIIDSNIKDGAKGVGRSSIIHITFNEPIVDGDLRLRIKGGGTVKTRVNYGNQTVHLERLGKDIVMKPLTTYVIEGTVADAAGNETEVELTFTTGEENF